MYKSKGVAFKNEVFMSLRTSDGESSDIDFHYIKAITTDYKFHKNLMPIVYATLDVPSSIYDKIVKNAADGEMYLNVQIYNAKEANAIHTTTIEQTFMYFVPTQYNTSNEFTNDGTEFKHIVIGMLQAELINMNKKTFNGVWTETNTQELLEMFLAATEERLSMDEIEIEKEYETITIPPQNSMADAIDYLFQTDPFYNENYLFFMDYDTTYLIATNGSEREFSSMPTVNIEVTKSKSRDVYFDGVVKDSDSGTYVLYVNESDVEFSINTTTEKNANQVWGISNVEISKNDINIAAQEPHPAKTVFEPDTAHDLASIKAKILENTSITLNITKLNLDASTITPDKHYNLTHPDYPEYDGTYILKTKNEYISQSGFDFDTVSVLSFERLADQ